MDIREEILALVKEANPANPLKYVHDIVRDMAREKLDQLIVGCQDCEICDHGKTITKGRSDATVMIISESLSEDQIDQGNVYPLENEAGEMLNMALDALHINQEEIFYINAVNCWPYKKNGKEMIHRTPTKKEVGNCLVFVEYAIEVVKPSLIILLGNIAMNLFNRAAISKVRGEWIDVKGIPAMPTYHPGYFNQIGNKKSPEEIEALQMEFFNDLKRAFKLIQEKYPNNNVILEPIE